MEGERGRERERGTNDKKIMNRKGDGTTDLSENFKMKELL